MSGYRLYADRFWISPYVFSSFVALTVKGVPFETVEIGLDRKDHYRPEYRAGSLTGRVPSLAAGDFWLAESSAIAEYLEEAHPDAPRLLPKDLRERARARMVMAWLRSDLAALRKERASSTIFFEKAKPPLGPEAKKDAELLVGMTETLLGNAGRGTLFSEWCLADSELSFMLHRLIASGDEVPARIRAYAEANWNRPAVRAFVEKKRPVFVPY